MAEYKYGVYAQVGADIVQNASEAGSAPVYFGTAPVNLLSGDVAAKVNRPLKISNLNEAQRVLGYFPAGSRWGKYTLCEAIAAHFANSKGNVGPIYVINVLDPETHRKGEQTSQSITFTNRRAQIVTDSIILSTFAIAEKVLGTDYTLSYNFTTGVLTITDIGTKEMSEETASFYEVDFEQIDESTVIGAADENGNLTGISAVALVYQECNVIPNYLAAPGWSDKKAVYNALVAAAQNINGHWSAFVFADLAIEEVTNIAAAKKWKKDNGYTSGFSKVCWPQVRGGDGNVYHISTLEVVEKLRVDLQNDNIPFETAGNKTIPVVGLYFGEGVKASFDKAMANELTAAGITTAVYWEGNWRIWGDHTAAYEYGSDAEVRYTFDVNVIMQFYIMNSFQRDWGSQIDAPMTVALSETILNREQEKLDALVARGALIGNPTVSFSTEDNPTDAIRAGQFVWNYTETNTPPFKAGTAIVSYTDAGFSSYYGEGGNE